MKKRYWLRGGGVGVAVTLIGGILFFFLAENNNDIDVFFSVLSYSVLYIPVKLTDIVTPLICTDTGFLLDCLWPAILVMATLFLIEIFGIGALIGYVYGKYRNRVSQ